MMFFYKKKKIQFAYLKKKKKTVFIEGSGGENGQRILL
jgi:hypothetical protein